MRAKAKNGLDPLHAAAFNTCAEAAAAAIQALVDAGADLNASAADGRRPLHCTAGRLPTALLLVRLGASLSLRDNAGRTTMEAAADGNAAAEAALSQDVLDCPSSRSRQARGSGTARVAAGGGRAGGRAGGTVPRRSMCLGRALTRILRMPQVYSIRCRRWLGRQANRARLLWWVPRASPRNQQELGAACTPV